MITVEQLATALRDRIARSGMTQKALSVEAGVSRQTLSKILSGQADLKVTTLFALADKLGMEVMLLPKDIAPDVAAKDEFESRTEPLVKSVVDAAMERIGTTWKRDPTHRQSD